MTSTNKKQRDKINYVYESWTSSILILCIKKKLPIL